jgi:mannose-6-phosphate isomerase-like protein (cupin superfamily)
MPSKIYHANMRKVPRESRLSGHYKRAAAIMDQALVSFVELSSGYDYPAGLPPDQHPFDQLMFMIEGRLEMILNGNESYVMETGDVLYIPANVMHSAKLINNEPCYLMEMFAPIRTDYLYTAEHQTTLGAVARESDGSRIDKRHWREQFVRPYKSTPPRSSAS